MKSVFLIQVILLAILSPGFGQQGKLLFHHLRMEDGLSEQTNLYVYKDSGGFIWISSISGLNRFDGTTVKVYLPDPGDPGALYGENIQSGFYEDKHSGMWFSTYQAINCYDANQDTFSHYFISEGPNDIPGYHIFHQDTNSNLWLIIENKGVYTFNTIHKKFSFISPFIVNANRAICVENIPGGLKKIFLYNISLDGIQEITVDQNHHVVSDIIILEINKGIRLQPRRILNDGDTTLWISTREALIKYHIESNMFHYHPLMGILALGDMNDSTLLISRDGLGVWEYSKVDISPVHQYVHESWNPFSLPTNSILYISKDKDGGLWMCSGDVALSYSYPDKNKFSFCTPNEVTGTKKSKFSPNGFFENSSDEIFCSTLEGGLYTLNRNCNVLHEWSSADPETDRRINRIYKISGDSKKNLYLSTFYGLSVIPAGTSRIHHITDQSCITWYGRELNNGKILFSAQPRGIFEINVKNGSYKLENLDSAKFNKEYVHIYQDSKGTLWFNEQLLKIILVDPVSLQTIGELPIVGMLGNFIENKNVNTVWISAATGLYEIDTRDYSITNLYRDSDKFGCSGFENMLQDEHGRLWLTCKNQITVFDTLAKTFKRFGQVDGLLNTQFNLYAANRFEDGEMWFGSKDGITRFYPDKILPIHIDAIPQITTLLVNDNEPKQTLVCHATLATNISKIEKLQFSFRENTLSFIVNSLEYSDPGNNMVEYKMEGLDKEWVSVYSGSLVRYPGLPPGKFTFLVKAANSDGIFSSFVRRLDILIAPPFYKTWWFITLSALAMLALVIYIVYLNFSKALELQKVRLRLYENLHDDVGSRLTAIVISAEDLAHNDNFANPKLERISGIAKSIVGNMRRLVWAIDPENDSMKNLVAKIRYDKNSILSDEINFHIEVAPDLEEKNIPGEIRYQLSSVINEALSNISKYAMAKNVWVTFGKSKNKLLLMIRDDGVGFNKTDVINDKIKASGYGLSNMEKRISRIKGNIVFKSTAGEGTTIEAIIPIP